MEQPLPVAALPSSVIPCKQGTGLSRPVAKGLHRLDTGDDKRRPYGCSGYHRRVIVGPDHWLTNVRRVPSPNQDARPDPADISLVVIHGISLPPGEFGGGRIEQLFRNRLDSGTDPRLADLKDVRVSAHILIARTGSVLQFVPLDRRAWHAGASSHRGRTDCNRFAIGIELEGTDEHPYTDRQYGALARVLGALRSRYPRIDPSAIVGHNEVAPGRKTDPGPRFDWSRALRGVLRQKSPP